MKQFSYKDLPHHWAPYGGEFFRFISTIYITSTNQYWRDIPTFPHFNAALGIRGYYDED